MKKEPILSGKVWWTGIFFLTDEALLPGFLEWTDTDITEATEYINQGYAPAMNIGKDSIVDDDGFYQEFYFGYGGLSCRRD